MKRAMFAVAMAAAAVLAATGTRADEETVVSYGVVEAMRPAAVSGGFLGLGEKPGMAYTIRRVGEAESIQVTSANVSFLAGDCLAVAGSGKDTTLTRARPALCSAAAATAPGRAPVSAPAPGHAPASAAGAGAGAWSSQGAGSPACKQAREEANTLPVGLARRRAVLRELVVCEPAPSPECRKAWDEVEALPFGPDRAAARARARRACDHSP